MVRRHVLHRSQLHDIVEQRSNQKKEAEEQRWNSGVRLAEFSIEDYFMVFQKNVGKLRPRWR